MPGQETLPAGAMLGKYRLLEHVGQGGMGAVYRAEHTVLKRTVAVKVLPPHLLRDVHAIQRFRREIEAAGKLDHPHIVRTSDAEQAQGQHFLVMEWLEGNDLAQEVKLHGPLAVDRAREFIRQAALGLAYAHERGMVHRDVKPSNLYHTMGQDGRAVVKVLDLGLALFQDRASPETELTHSGQVMGTFDFIAPEQSPDSHNVDLRADIYSLGCTLYFLLTGRPPFPGNSLATKILAHQLHMPLPATQLRPDVPADLAGIVAKMMAKKATDRYASMHEVAEALAGVGSAPTASAKGTEPFMPRDRSSGQTSHMTDTAAASSAGATSKLRSPSPKPLFKHRAVHSAVFVAIGVLIVGAAFFVWSQLKSDTRQKPESVDKGLAKEKDDKGTLAKPTEPPVPSVVPKETPLPKASPVPTGPPLLDVVTRLGVRQRVEVGELMISAGAGTRLGGILFSRADTTHLRNTGIGATGLGRICLGQGNGLFLLIPIRQVKTIEAKADAHVATLVDGRTIKGKILTAIRDLKGKDINLADVNSATVLNPGPTPADKSKLGAVLAPMGHAEMYQLSAYYFQSGRLPFGNQFKMKVDADTLEPDLRDFKQVVVTGKGALWRIRVTPPAGKPAEGDLDVLGFGGNYDWWFIGVTAQDWLIVMTSRESEGFTLTQKVRE